jgi:hypothetical protein
VCKLNHVHGICDEVAQRASGQWVTAEDSGWKSDVGETDSLTLQCSCIMCEGSVRTAQETRVVNWEGESGNAVSGHGGCLLQKSYGS